MPFIQCDLESGRADDEEKTALILKRWSRGNFQSRYRFAYEGIPMSCFWNTRFEPRQEAGEPSACSDFWCAAKAAVLGKARKVSLDTFNDVADGMREHTCASALAEIT